MNFTSVTRIGTFQATGNIKTVDILLTKQDTRLSPKMEIHFIFSRRYRTKAMDR